MGKLYAGVHFLRDDESNVANITIVNNTKSQDVIRDYSVDLWIGPNSGDQSAGTYEDYVFWYPLPYPDDDYTVTVSNGGASTNPNAVYPVGVHHIQIQQYFIKESLEDSRVKADVIVWHSDHLEQHIFPDVDLTQSSPIELNETQTFTADGIITDFTLSTTNRASDFIQFSDDAGNSWKEIYDTSITWGSNVDLDDETIDANGYFGIKFDVAPTLNVHIKYQVKCNKFKVKRTFKASTDGINYYDLTKPVRLINDAVEMLP